MRFHVIPVSLIVLAMALSCKKEEQDSDNQTRQTVTITATLSDALTKVTFTPGLDADNKPLLSLTWAEGDFVRVYDHEDHSQYSDFAIETASIGQRQGRFSGPALIASSYDVSVLNPSVNYIEQTQPKDGDTGDLKYIASAENLSNYNSITFTDICSMLLLQAKMPSTEAAAAIASAEIDASEAIFHNNGKSIRITLSQKGDEGADAILNLYAYLPAGNTSIPEGTSLLIRFNAPGTEHTVYSRYIELPAQDFSSGKLNMIKLNCTHSEQFAGASDDGSENHPYLIADKYQMQAMHELLVAGEKKYFKLVDHIDLDDDAWIPVSGNTKYVHLDGNDKTLSHFTVTGTTDPTGLFSALNGQVKDLTIDGATVNATTGAIGVLAGDLGNGGSETAIVENVTLTNCHVGSADFSGVGGVLAGNIRKAGTTVKGVTVTGSDVTSKNNYVGGLVGYVRFASAFENCRISGCAVSGKDISGGMFGSLGASSQAPSCSLCFVENTTIYGSYRRVGGLAGWHQAGTIASCGVEADVSVSSPSYDVGGITGIQDAAATVENSYSRASLSGSSNVGGLVGRLSGTVKCCYASGIPSTEGTKGGLVGLINSGASVSKCISWNADLPLYGSNSGTVSDCYIQVASETGTVSSHAQESPRNWSADVWDFSTDFPTLKGTGSSSGDDPEPTYAYHLIPYPASLTEGSGNFSVYGAPLYFDTSFGSTGADVADQIAARLGVNRGSTSGEGEASGINILKDASLGDEAYTIHVSPEKTVIKASSRTGIFYAWQTLKQLLPSAVYGTGAVTSEWTLPCLAIEDAPRFAWRGMHLDVSRHFFPVEEIKEYLDIMALYKLNRFHWHLTDDQGWRVEIEGDDNLTRLSAYRNENPISYPGWNRDNGFYSKEQIAEIVAYAHERCIIVVPEVDLPGHAAAILNAHNELACTTHSNFGDFGVWTTHGINRDLLCVAKATSGTTADILDNIVKQLALMFPQSEYIHFGGDETRAGASYTTTWDDCTDCNALITSLGLETDGNVTKKMRLQYYFTKYMCNLAAKYGKKMMGWQEIWTDIRNHSDFDANDLPGVCVESWTQAGHGLNATKAGLYGLVAPSYSHYLSYGQDPAGDAGSNVLMNECYTLTLNGSTGLTAEQEARFLGTEACIWTESITSLNELEFMMLPRLGAISEVAWTQPVSKDYARLKESITDKHFDMYDALGYNYRSTVDF